LEFRFRRVGIALKLGYPTERFYEGIDPRNNRKIIKWLIMDKKVK